MNNSVKETTIHDELSYDERRSQIDAAHNYVMHKHLTKETDLRNERALAMVGGFVVGMLFSLFSLHPELITFFISGMH